MAWTMPSLEEQQKQLIEAQAFVGGRVRFRTSDFEWVVTGLTKIGVVEGRTISVHLKSPTSGRKRTAWPWELRGPSKKD